MNKPKFMTLISLQKVAFIFVFATGFTGLVYQVVWQKYLTHYLGSHSLATSSILGIFFLFLSLGYLVLGRNSHRIMKNQFLLYGILETLIGIYCLFSPGFFHWLHATFPAGAENPAADLTLGLLFSAVFIGFPTFLMGGTIPVLTQGFSAQFQTSHKTHATIYGLNTLGAFLGTIVAGFYLVQTFGLPLTLMNTALVNLFIGLSIWLITKASPLSFEGVKPKKETKPKTKEERGWYAVLYSISFLSGFYVFSLESIMIRMTGMALGSTSYNYSLIVASFILAIAIGSIIVGQKTISSARFFLITQVSLLVATFLLYLAIPEIPTWFMRVRFLFSPLSFNLSPYWVVVFVALVFILLIPVGLMGMNLPLLFNYLRQKNQYLSAVVGRIYSINTLGSVFGATLGGYFLFYFIRTDSVFKLNLTMIALTIPLIAALGLKDKKHTKHSAIGSVIAILVIWLTPNWNDAAFNPGKFTYKFPPSTSGFSEYVKKQDASVNLVFSAHGPDTIVGVNHSPSGNVLFVGGNANTAPTDMGIRAMNALTPLSLKVQPKSAFIVGLGAGLSTSLLADEPTVEKVEVAEIAKGVIDALPYFDKQNDKLSEKLDKVKIHHADAFKVLNASDKKYDIIVSEPAHPWVAGVENLFTVEFLETIKNHLSEDGVYSQWFPLYTVNEEIVYTIARSFTSVFPWVVGFNFESSVITFIASKNPPKLDSQWIAEVFERHHHFTKIARFKEPFSFLMFQSLTGETLKLMAKKGGIHSLELPKVAFLSEKSRFLRQVVSMDKILKENIFRPVGRDEKPFLYQQLDMKPKQVEDAITRGLRLVPNVMRAVITLRDQKPNSKLLTKTFRSANKDAELESYFRGKSNTLPKALVEPEIKETLSAFETASKLISAQIPVDLRRVARIIPKSCRDLKEKSDAPAQPNPNQVDLAGNMANETETLKPSLTCISMKRTLLVNLYYAMNDESGLEFLRRANWKLPEVQVKIEELFRKTLTELKL